jgi:hypothetical protein
MSRIFSVSSARFMGHPIRKTGGASIADARGDPVAKPKPESPNAVMDVVGRERGVRFMVALRTLAPTVIPANFGAPVPPALNP